MTRHHRLDAHFSGALHDCFKIVDFEPQQYPVSIWLVVAIANRPVMMFHLEAVQLKDKLPIRDQLFICRAPMIAPAAEQTLVPSAAGFHIGHGDQRLRTHTASLSIHTAAMATYFGRFLSTRSAHSSTFSIRDDEIVNGAVIRESAVRQGETILRQSSLP
jgi:hypothetical protein